MTDVDWKSRAEAAEARVKELEADRDYWKIEAEGERAKVARRDRQRLTVTDEMVETAMKRILKDWKAAGIAVKPELEASEIAARAALTAALENSNG